MISIQNLKKVYPNVTPFYDVNVEIKQGEVISIIGPSGTGKSTLLRCLNLLESPTEGQIFVDGQEITAKGPTCQPCGGRWAWCSSPSTCSPTSPSSKTLC